MNLLAVDPGLNKAGVALFSDGRLVLARTARRPKGSLKTGPAAWVEMAHAITRDRGDYTGHKVDALVAETMKVYQGQPGAADLLQLNGVVGAVAADLWWSGTLTVGAPANIWTKGVPKQIRNARAFEALTHEERLAVDGNSTHDAWDAVSLGLWYLKKEGLRHV